MRLRQAAMLLISSGVAACASSVSNASSREVVSPVTDQYVWVIECDARPDACEQEAKRVCPSGHRTLEGGKESWYADDEEPFSPQLSPKERKNYKRVGWTIACS
jgi:hypothetical protein